MTWKTMLATVAAITILLTAGIGAARLAATDSSSSPPHPPSLVTPSPSAPPASRSASPDGMNVDDVQTAPGPEETLPPCTPGGPSETFLCVESAAP
jgi:hypothetical protein